MQARKNMDSFELWLEKTSKNTENIAQKTNKWMDH